MIGEWIFPDGTRVNSETLDPEQVVFAHNQLGRVTLQARAGRQFSSALEGVYSCLIPDEIGAVRTLHAGVYSANTYNNLGSYLAACFYKHKLSPPPCLCRWTCYSYSSAVPSLKPSLPLSSYFLCDLLHLSLPSNLTAVDLQWRLC